MPKACATLLPAILPGHRPLPLFPGSKIEKVCLYLGKATVKPVNMIVDSGVTPGTNAFDKRRIQLVNFIALASIVVGTIGEAYTLLESGFILVSITPYLLAMALLVGIIYFNATGKYAIGRVILALMCNVSLLFHFISLDESLMAAQLHLVNYIIYIAIFKKFKSIFFWSTITLGVYFFGTYLQVYTVITPIFVPDARLIPAYRFVYILLTSALIVSITLFFKKVNDDHQQALKSGNEKLQRALETINSQNTALQKNVGEKEVLLQEVHHRVKNNLQVIISLIDLQMDKRLAAHDSAVLDECKSRVSAMALVHEKLYQSNSFEQINLQEYLSGLVNNISQGHTRARVTTELAIGNFKISMDNTIQLGLIVNELVTNAYKHAFKHNRQGILRVSLKKNNHLVLLTIHDNGKGLPAGFDVNALGDDKLGIKLVRMLAKQLQGESAFAYDNGLKVTITFAA